MFFQENTIYLYRTHPSLSDIYYGFFHLCRTYLALSDIYCYFLSVLLDTSKCGHIWLRRTYLAGTGPTIVIRILSRNMDHDSDHNHNNIESRHFVRMNYEPWEKTNNLSIEKNQKCFKSGQGTLKQIWVISISKSNSIGSGKTAGTGGVQC